jgi:hypothetical protein
MEETTQQDQVRFVVQVNYGIGWADYRYCVSLKDASACIDGMDHRQVVAKEGRRVIKECTSLRLVTSEELAEAAKWER